MKKNPAAHLKLASRGIKKGAKSLPVSYKKHEASTKSAPEHSCHMGHGKKAKKGY